jgi:hypothetical protein
MFTPGTFNVFFHNGPLAWNGIIAWYLPLVVFATWMIVNPIHLSKAVDTMDWDALVAPETTSADGAELTRLRADVDQLLARAAR